MRKINRSLQCLALLMAPLFLAGAQKGCEVRTDVGPGGSISPESIMVEKGEYATFTITPDEGYQIKSATGCDGFLSEYTYTTGRITDNCTVRVRFSPIEPGCDDEMIDGRYQPTGDNCELILDTVTNLEWQRCSVGQTWNGTDCVGHIGEYWPGPEGDCLGGSECLDSNGQPVEDNDPHWYTFHQAKELGSEGRFRLPTLEELRTLTYCSSGTGSDRNGNYYDLDIGNPWYEVSCAGNFRTPAINQQAFPSTTAYPYWSADSCNPTTSTYPQWFAWEVDFFHTKVSGQYEEAASRVRLVRDRHEPMSTLVGLVFDKDSQGDAGYAIEGARVTLSNGQSTLTNHVGYYYFDVPAGEYSITVSKNGFESQSIIRRVRDEGEAWGSVALVRKSNEVGALIGVIYVDDDTSDRVPHAFVWTSTGHSTYANEKGIYTLDDVPAGDVTIYASAGGHTTGMSKRHLPAFQQRWGSVSLRRTYQTTTQDQIRVIDPIHPTYVAATSTSPIFAWNHHHEWLFPTGVSSYYHVVLLDNSGQRVFETTLPTTTNTIELSDLSSLPLNRGRWSWAVMVIPHEGSDEVWAASELMNFCVADEELCFTQRYGFDASVYIAYTGDASHDARFWLSAFAHVLSKRDARSASLFFDPEHRDIQLSLGTINNAQYVLEGIGATVRSNHVSGPIIGGGPIAHSSALAELHSIEINSVVPARDSHGNGIADKYEANGYMHYSQGSIYRINIPFRLNQDGAWTIYPAVG